MLYLDTFECVIAGNSHLSGPNVGTVTRIPRLFFNGFENEQRVSFPSVDNHAGLTTVRPLR